MAERSRVSSSVAAPIVLAGTEGIEPFEGSSQAGQEHHFALGLPTKRAARAERFLESADRFPSERGKNSDRGLLDKLVFAVGVEVRARLRFQYLV